MAVPGNYANVHVHTRLFVLTLFASGFQAFGALPDHKPPRGYRVCDRQVPLPFIGSHSTELQCSACLEVFQSSSALLRHFAEHVRSHAMDEEDGSPGSTKSKIPDLLPINFKVVKKKNLHHSKPLTDEDASAKAGSKAKRHRCEYCGRTFGWSTDLKRHVFTHTGQRPYKCPWCTACYTRKVHLTKHTRKRHMDLQLDGVMKSINRRCEG